MIKITLTTTLLLITIATFGQRVRIIETDTVTYFIDTLSVNCIWGASVIATNANSQSNGAENTIKIVKTLGAGNYPAYRCDTMILNGKSDWFLPSGDESKIVYKNLNSLKIFPTRWYCTSSEESTEYAWMKWFGGGEGDIYESRTKNIYDYRSFCIRKEKKLATGMDENSTEDKRNNYYKLYDLSGKEAILIMNKFLIKRYEDGRVEKFISIE